MLLGHLPTLPHLSLPPGLPRINFISSGQVGIISSDYCNIALTVKYSSLSLTLGYSV